MTEPSPRPTEATGTDDAAWRGFVARFVVVFFGGLVVVLAVIVLVDPYDSGRFPAIGHYGVSDESQRTANVSLGRNETFNAAVFGNSHGQLLDPERLSQATGLSFVQLTIPGANAPEQIAMMHWFIRHHARIGALVLAADDRWCSEDPQPWNRFPLWLYGDSDVRYLASALNSRSIGAAFRRVKHAMGLVRPSDPRGYDDYEIGVPANYKFVPSPVPDPDESHLGSSGLLGERRFPAIDRLAAELALLPAAVRIVILFPPRHASALKVNAGRMAVLTECKVRLARLVAGSRGRGFLDFLIDSPMTREPGNFVDSEHYRARVARQIESEIARILNGQMSDAR
jgi:hypothetical protein